MHTQEAEVSNGPNSGNPRARRIPKVVGSAARGFRVRAGDMFRALKAGRGMNSTSGIQAVSAVAAVAFYLVSGTLALDEHCSEPKHSIAVVESVCHRMSK